MHGSMHSAPGRQVGWEKVRAAWEQFANLTSGGQGTVHDLLVRIGSDLAYTIGTERIEATLAGADHRQDERRRRKQVGNVARLAPWI
jgi:hypothetical protein